MTKSERNEFKIVDLKNKYELLPMQINKGDK